ncbi:MAG TPA: glycosyltransferase family 4 protein [Caulobacteraceae bacterium]|jgi:glycosyltransferase involved in cell wall biosynthesis|nr:glycosyltransferase family 4 protein [Caulobacteraceae bacterium]
MSDHRSIKLGVIGAKGVGDLQGGIETYCANFYKHLTPGRFDITVFVSRDASNAPAAGLNIIRIRSPRLFWLEIPFVALVAVVWAKLRGIRVLHVHGIGAAICLPLASLLGFRIVVRYLGHEYDAPKWGRLGRTVLRTCERFVALFAHHIVCLSEPVAERLRAATGRTKNVHVIPNGVVEPPERPVSPKVAEVMAGDEPFILAVGRIVRAKNFHLLIEAFLQSRLPAEAILVIAGEIDFPGSYGAAIENACNGSTCVRRIGTVFGADLWRLYRGCRLFVLPSMHEGMSFSLLEAGLAGAAIIASDISENAAVLQGLGRLAKVNSVEALRSALEEEWDRVREPRMVEDQIAAFRSRHDWREIAERTEAILAFKGLEPSTLSRQDGAELVQAET